MVAWIRRQKAIGGTLLCIELSEQEAFRAAPLFLDRFYKEAGDDLATLMMDTTIEADGRTHDPAAREDWMNCIRIVKGGVTP